MREENSLIIKNLSLTLFNSEFIDKNSLINMVTKNMAWGYTGKLFTKVKFQPISQLHLVWKLRLRT